jgi:hypothetical protein
MCYRMIVYFQQMSIHPPAPDPLQSMTSLPTGLYVSHNYIKH